MEPSICYPSGSRNNIAREAWTLRAVVFHSGGQPLACSERSRLIVPLIERLPHGHVPLLAEPVRRGRIAPGEDGWKDELVETGEIPLESIPRHLQRFWRGRCLPGAKCVLSRLMLVRLMVSFGVEARDAEPRSVTGLKLRSARAWIRQRTHHLVHLPIVVSCISQ